MKGSLIYLALALGALAVALSPAGDTRLSRTVSEAMFVVLAAFAIHEALGKPIPFLRWSFLRLGLSWKRVSREWHVGDGREVEAEAFVCAHAAAGDLDAAIAAFDRFAYEKKFLFNVGDEKGAILDKVVSSARPERVLELGTYLGYSALRIVRELPATGHLYSIEWNEKNAAIARRILRHARIEDRVTILRGSLNDDGHTMKTLACEHGFEAGNVDLVFIDHDKNEYQPDLERILAANWLHRGSVVLADNVRLPGAPAYRAFIASAEGLQWTSRVHRAHAEYQSLLRDEMIELTMLR